MDWVRFLEENNIHFVTRGPNTKKGEVSVQCPMCGQDDPSEHLGINPTTGFWGCHRNPLHRGKSARTLIKAILGCSSRQAQLVLTQYSNADPDTLNDILLVLEHDKRGLVKDGHKDFIAKAKNQRIKPEFDDFYPIKARGLTKRFFVYLQERGYDNPQEIIEAYNLKCSLTGQYKDRIIIPVHMNGELLGWTSRALGAVKSAPRYLASSEDVKATVFNYDEIKHGGDRLFVVEGPFDAIKMDSHKGRMDAHEVRFRATCTFGTSPTVSQIALLRALAKNYKETWVLFDQGADEPSRNLAEWIGAKSAFLPHNIKDPGELKEGHLVTMSRKTFSGGLYDYSSLIDITRMSLTKNLAKNLYNTNPFLDKLIKK